MRIAEPNGKRRFVTCPPGPGQIWKQRIPDPSEPITTACFEVYKMGKHQRTHLFSGDKSSWIIG